MSNDERQPLGSERLARFLRHGPCGPPRSIELEPADREQLRSAALREGGLDRGDRIRALWWLRTEAEADDQQTMQRILLDEDDDPHTRAAAAVALGRHRARGTEDLLVSALQTGVPLVRSTVIDSLGRVGGPRGLEALRGLDPPAQGYVRRQLDLAIMTIAFREGIEGIEPIAFPAVEQSGEPPGGETRAVTIARKVGRQAAALLGHFDDHHHGLTLSRDLAFTVQRGETRLDLLLDEPATGAGLDPLLERPRLLGIVARLGLRGGASNASQLVFSKPVGPRTIRLLAVRLDGQPRHAGELERRRGGTRFRITSLPQPGAVWMWLEGSVEGDALHLDDARAATRRSPKRSVQPLEVPASEPM